MTSVLLHGSGKPVFVPKIICIGRNYAEHAKEMKSELPAAPIFFFKPPSALMQSGGAIVRPSISKELHHEVEVTILLGKGGKAIPEQSAMDHIAGYGVGLDMTLRDVQSEAKKKGLPWALAKGFDTSAPVSEFVPASAVTDPHRLTIELRVNGVVRQKGSTSDFLFTLPRLISFISRFITLDAGDIIFTGTPEGIAETVPGDTLEALLGEPGKPPLTGLKVRVEAGQ